ncbi:MAG: hypothetical protein Q9175_000163 [Cornicularia normoerica]
MNCVENYTQSSTEFQQRLKSLDNTVCNIDGASNGGILQPASRTVEDHAMVPPPDVEEDMIATLASVAPCASLFLSRRFRNLAHTETESYVKHSVYHDTDTSGAKLKQLHVSRLLSEDENAEGPEAEPEMLLQPETGPISRSSILVQR